MATTQKAEPISKEVIDPEGDLILVLPNEEVHLSRSYRLLWSRCGGGCGTGNEES